MSLFFPSGQWLGRRTLWPSSFHICPIDLFFLWMAMDLRRDRPLIFLFILSSTARQQGTKRQELKCRKKGQQELTEKEGERRHCQTFIYNSQWVRITQAQQHSPLTNISTGETPPLTNCKSLDPRFGQTDLVVGDLFVLSQCTASKNAAFQNRSVCLSTDESQFSRFYYKKIKTVMQNLGFRQVEHDFCVYESRCNSTCDSERGDHDPERLHESGWNCRLTAVI